MHQFAPRQIVAREILKTLHPLDLRNLAKNREIITPFQAAAYLHRVRSRDAAALRVSPASDRSPEDSQLIERVYALLSSQRLVQVDLQVCASEPWYHVRLFVPLYHADLAYMASRAFLPAPAECVKHLTAGITVVVLPEWGETRLTLVDPDASIAYILGSDYYGDIHDTILRLTARHAQRQGLITLHAACLEIRARSRKTGQLNTCGVLLFGQGNAGKTTLATADYALDATAGEQAVVRQDDRVILHPSGRVQGTEGQGLYVRTAGLTLQDRPLLWPAVNHEDAVLENVWTNPDGRLDYANETLTTNGRAIGPLRQIPGFEGQIDISRCTHMIFLVRDEMTAPAVRLTAQQAVDLFAKASATESAASVDEEANKPFAAFLQQNPGIYCFAVSTGQICQGQSLHKTTPAESAAAILEICREAQES